MDKDVKFNQTKYVNEYVKKHYKPVSLRLKPDAAKIIDTFCKDMGYSKNEYIGSCVLYCIRHSIPLDELKG
jgi:hypothetical protein